jgi:hypothetical protein
MEQPNLGPELPPNRLSKALEALERRRFRIAQREYYQMTEQLKEKVERESPHHVEIEEDVEKLRRIDL